MKTVKDVAEISGVSIRTLRYYDEIGLQQQLADLLHVARATVAGYETKFKKPEFEKIVWMANYFDVSIDYLLGKTDSRQIGTAPAKKESISDAEAEKILEQKFIENGILKEGEHLSDEKLDKYLKMLRALQDIADTDQAMFEK